jgi:hypothetical protein
MPDDTAIGRDDLPAASPGGRGRLLTPAAEDPVVRSGRREAFWTLALWLTATIYSVTYCTLCGYDRSVESLSFVLWFPDWVFWGIVAPWFICAAISIYFAIWVIEDDPLTSSDDAVSEDSPPDDRASSREAGGV